jgi:hypothetical protein
MTHPSIVRVYSLWLAGRRAGLYLVMELVRGWTLRRELAAGVPARTRRASRILADGVCGAMETAHRGRRSCTAI